MQLVAAIVQYEKGGGVYDSAHDAHNHDHA